MSELIAIVLLVTLVWAAVWAAWYFRPGWQERAGDDWGGPG